MGDQPERIPYLPMAFLQKEIPCPAGLCPYAVEARLLGMQNALIGC